MRIMIISHDTSAACFKFPLCYSALFSYSKADPKGGSAIIMKTSECYLPEGSYAALPAVRQALASPDGLRRAQDEGMILEAPAQRCTPAHDLLFDLGFAQGIMPRACCALGVAEGDTREIAILSRVGKPTCFAVTGVDAAADPPAVWLSRTIAQQRAQDWPARLRLTPGRRDPRGGDPPRAVRRVRRRRLRRGLAHRDREPVGLAHLPPARPALRRPAHLCRGARRSIGRRAASR